MCEDIGRGADLHWTRARESRRREGRGRAARGPKARRGAAREGLRAASDCSQRPPEGQPDSWCSTMPQSTTIVQKRPPRDGRHAARPAPRDAAPRSSQPLAARAASISERRAGAAAGDTTRRRSGGYVRRQRCRSACKVRWQPPTCLARRCRGRNTARARSSERRRHPPHRSRPAAAAVGAKQRIRIEELAASCPRLHPRLPRHFCRDRAAAAATQAAPGSASQ